MPPHPVASACAESLRAHVGQRQGQRRDTLGALCPKQPLREARDHTEAGVTGQNKHPCRLGGRKQGETVSWVPRRVLQPRQGAGHELDKPERGTPQLIHSAPHPSHKGYCTCPVPTKQPSTGTSDSGRGEWTWGGVRPVQGTQRHDIVQTTMAHAPARDPTLRFWLTEARGVQEHPQAGLGVCRIYAFSRLRLHRCPQSLQILPITYLSSLPLGSKLKGRCQSHSTYCHRERKTMPAPQPKQSL